jgi:two-component system, chemotaxis family, chemotaxis protein CheY
MNSMTKVLICDDNQDIRDLTRMCLKIELGISTVEEAPDGRRGVDIARTWQPDVVILDLEMPVMDGLEALPLIRAGAPEAKVIVASSWVRQEVQSRVIDLGADRYVEKFPDAHKVIDLIREWVTPTPPGPASAVA